MRQGTNHKRLRGRGAARKHSQPSRSHNFDSNGPSGRIRGNAYQVYEKYLSLARDAHSSGDRVTAENYFQHAEHYYRIVNFNTEASRPPPRPESSDFAPPPSGLQAEPQPELRDGSEAQPHNGGAEPPAAAEPEGAGAEVAGDPADHEPTAA